MARDRERHWVCRARARDRARAVGHADLPRELAVAQRLAGRGRLERAPHALLERGAADVERQVQRRARTLDERDRGGEPALERVGARRRGGLRKARRERPRRRVARRRDLDGADAALGGGDADPAERRSCERVADALPSGAAAIGRRRHAEEAPRVLVHAARGAVAGAVDGGVHRLARAQRALQSVAAACGVVLARRDAHRALEEALEVKAAQSRRGRECGERRRRVRGLDRADRRADPIHGVVARRHGALGVAAAARPEAGAGRGGGTVEEQHVLRLRAPRRAGRTTEDAGRLHGVDERAVGGGVASGYCTPAGGVLERRVCEVHGGGVPAVDDGRTLGRRPAARHPEVALKF
jgi:hypothetical protein